MAYRDGPLQDLKLPLTWAAAGATLIAILGALVFLLAGPRTRSASDGYAAARNLFDRALAPVEGVLETPVEWVQGGIDDVAGYFFAVSQNRRLKQQVRELEGWRDTAVALKNVNDRYEALLKLKTEPEAPMVSARTVMDARGPFANARVLDVGSEAGITIGDPAISEHGVVGRIIGVTRGASRMLLLNDVESRTPVLVDRTNARAILTGDGGNYPQLEYVRGRDPLKDGDMILTSGDGGVFPRGLPVGVAARDLKGGWRVKLYSDQTPIDYVRILLYQDFGAKVPPAALSGAALPPLTASEQVDRAQALQQAAAAPPSKPPAAASHSASVQVTPVKTAPFKTAPAKTVAARRSAAPPVAPASNVDGAQESDADQ